MECSEKDAHKGHIRASEAVHDNVIRATQRVEIHSLHSIHVHCDVGDVAEETKTRTVGRKIDILIYVGAVEYQGVDSTLTFNGIAAIAWVPLDGVVARTGENGVVAAVAVDEVVARATDDYVVAVATTKDVIAVTAIDREGNIEGGKAAR